MNLNVLPSKNPFSEPLRSVNETFSGRYETHINKLIQEVFKGNP
jgi:hypothetical protein